MGCALAIVFQVRSGYLLGVCFRESLVLRLHSEIDQIHLSIEAQCGTPVYLWVTATPRRWRSTCHCMGHHNGLSEFICRAKTQSPSYKEDMANHFIALLKLHLW